MTKTISLLGATGSIGRQTLAVAQELGLSVAALTANRQVDLLEQQARQFRPRLAVLYDPAAAKELRERLRGTGIEVMEGPEGLTAAATLPEADTVVTAVMGSVGLAPTLAAIMEKKRIALANKETLVCAGELVMSAARETGAEIVPVDSEHSAIFQCLQGCRDRGEVRRLLLTCSGGPFFGRSFDELEHVTAADALKHPNWTMGAKITIDSATLMNKGLEIIEAMRLYDLPVEQVEAVIHRQSIVHSLVEFRDGAMLAQLGTPDMKLPIRYAMTYPYRAETPDRRLAILLHDSGKPDCFTLDEAGIGHMHGHAERSAEIADEVLSSLRVDNATRERVTLLVRSHSLSVSPDPKLLRRRLNQLGEEALRELLLLQRADQLGKGTISPEEIKAEYRAVVAALDALMATSPCFTLKSLAVSGRDLMAAGLPKGHIIGQALAYLLDEVMAERLPNARDALLDAAIRQFGGMS